MTTETQSLPVTSRPSTFRWRRLLLAFAVTLVALLAIVAIGSFVYASSNAGRILPGVSIGGVSVSGLTAEQAKEKLETALPDVGAGSLTVKAGSVQDKISYSDIARGYDVDSAIEEAMNVGREGNPLQQVGDQFRTMSSGVALTPTVGYDATSL